MDTADFLRHLQSLLWYQDQMVHVEQIPVREATIGQIDPPLDERLYRKLDETGVTSLYAHQVEAVHALRQGRNIIVATPAASGKSMCYNLPVIDALLTDKSARALYLYPTKALAQDQEKKLAALDCLESQGYSGAYARKRIETTDGAFGVAAGTAYAEGFISANAETYYHLPVSDYSLTYARSSDHERMARYSHRIPVD